MPAKGQCSACLSTRRSAAEEMHRTGTSARAIEAETGIKRNTFLRHARVCMGRRSAGAAESPATPPSVPPPESPPLVDVLPVGPPDHPLARTLADRAEVYSGMLDAFRAITEGPASARDRAALAPSLLRAIKDQESSIARVPAPKGVEERMRDNPSFVAYQGVEVRVLMRFPDARQALVEALNAELAEEGPW